MRSFLPAEPPLTNFLQLGSLFPVLKGKSTLLKQFYLVYFVLISTIPYFFSSFLVFSFSILFYFYLTIFNSLYWLNHGQHSSDLVDFTPSYFSYFYLLPRLVAITMQGPILPFRGTL